MRKKNVCDTSSGNFDHVLLFFVFFLHFFDYHVPFCYMMGCYCSVCEGISLPLFCLLIILCRGRKRFISEGDGGALKHPEV